MWVCGPDGLHKHLTALDSTQPNLEIVSGHHSIGKSSQTNEDALFVSERSFGIADGVSGWVDFGFSSKEFSNQLMRNCKA